MIIVLKPTADAAVAEEILAQIEAKGCRPLHMPGSERVVLGALGDERVLAELQLENHPSVEQVQPILTPYKLVSREELSGQDDAHQRDFLDAIKEGRQPNADIEVGHLSSALCHLGNIVARVGRAIRLDPETEQVIGDDEANVQLRRKYREDYWAVPEGV